MARILKALFSLSLLALLYLILPSTLRADTFNWTCTCDPTQTPGCVDNASGTLTTAGPGTGSIAGAEEITAITGTYDGSAITALLADTTCCGSPADDQNLLIPGPPYLTYGGLGFAVGTLDVNLYNVTGSEYVDLTCTASSPLCISDATFVSIGDFTVVPTVETPEPSALLLLFVGTVGLIGLARKRRTFRSQLD